MKWFRLVPMTLMPILGSTADAWAQQVGSRYEPHMWGWHGWFFGPIMMIVFIAIAVVVVVVMVRWLGGVAGGAQTHPQPSSHRTPLDILKERFARGEIDKDEFEERRRVLDQ